MDYVIYGLCGALGGLIHSLLRHEGILILPARWRDGNKRGWDLGFVFSVLVGIGVAIAVDSNPMTAIGWSFAGPEAVELISKKFSK